MDSSPEDRTPDRRSALGSIETSADSSVDAHCERFEASFDERDGGDLRRHLEGVPPEQRERVFLECLLVKQWRLRERGLRYGLEAALREFPEYEAQVRRCFPAADGAPGPSIETDGTTATSPTAAGTSPLDERYEIRRRLGVGAFGEVFEGFDRRLRRTVAVKVARSPLAGDRSTAERFLAEARTVAQLEHPGIVPVFDAGLNAQGRPFTVSRLIAGRDLQAWADAQAPSPTRVATMVAAVAEALQYAHQRGVVHRDVKLANILVDADGSPVLCDFGLATHETERRLRRDELSGSPCYMAPEQVRGDGVQIDGRTDVWALGICLYKLLTGVYPFEDDATDIVFEEILRRSPRPPRQLDAALPVALEAIVLRCLQKRIDDRFRSAADLRDALTDWVASVSADRRAEVRSAGGSNSKRPPLAIAGVAGMSLVVAAVAATFAWSQRPAANRPTETRPTETRPTETRPAPPQREVPYQNAALASPPVTPSEPPVTPSEPSAAPSEPASEISFAQEWRIGNVPPGFDGVRSTASARTVEAPLAISGDFDCEMRFEVQNQGPRNGEGFEALLTSEADGESFGFALEIAQAFSDGRTLAIRWPGRGLVRIEVARGLRTVRLSRTGDEVSFAVDGLLKPTAASPLRAVWSSNEIRGVQLTLKGAEMSVASFELRPARSSRGAADPP